MRRQSLIKKSTEIFLKLISFMILLILILQVTSRAQNNVEEVNLDKLNNMVRKTEIITTFDWIQDVDSSIGSITIEEEGRKVNMTGNRTLPGKNAIYIIPENHQEQNLTFDYSVDYGDSFNAAGILLKIREQDGYLEGYLLSFNNPSGYSDWYSGAENKLGAIWTIRYQLGTNTSDAVEKTLVKALDIPQSGTVSVKATENQIILTGENINETVDTTGNTATGDGFGFFTNHYSHNCDQIGHFALTNFGLQTVDLIPHDFIVDPNGGVWNGSEEETAIEGIYQDTVDVPVPTREGYTFVKWTQIGDSGTMSSLTEDAVYTFGENEEIDDKIVAEWIRIVGEKTSNVQSGEVKVNDTITYTVTLRNEGTVDGKGIIFDEVPQGTQFVESSIKINGEETEYTLENLNDGIEVDVPQGGETSISFDVIVNDLDDDALITNTANYRDITVEGKESDGETNQVDLTYVEPIISFYKEATTEHENEYVTTDETIEYRIIAQNAGGLAQDVTIQDMIPEGTTFVDGSIKIDGEETDYTEEDLESGIEVNVPEKTRRTEVNSQSVSDMLKIVNMNVLQSDSLPGEVVLTFEVTVDEQKDENQIVNIAKVDGTETNEIDYTYRKPIISAEKLMETENGLDYVVSKENIQFSIVVKNSGSVPKNVIIQDMIPEGTTFVNASIEIDGEETSYKEADLKEGIEVEVPQKHIKEDNEEETENEETPDNTDNEQETENTQDVENSENTNNQEDEQEINALSNDVSTIEETVGEDSSLENNNVTDNEESTDGNTEEDNNITDSENDENNTEEPNSDEEQSEDSNLQENEEPGQVILTFNVLVDDLNDDTETMTIKNVAKVDSEETNETSIEVLPFNLKIETEVEGFTVNGSKKQSSNPKLAKTDIDMRRSSPTPDVTANIKIKVTNTGKIEGSSVVEATIPEGFTLSSSQWQSSGTNTVRTETDKIAPGETEELSLDVKWNNSETNLGERNTKAEIIETSNEARAAETTTEDNESEADMIIGIVTGEYDNIIILSIIGVISLLAIIGEIILIKKYVL